MRSRRRQASLMRNRHTPGRSREAGGRLHPRRREGPWCLSCSRAGSRTRSNILAVDLPGHGRSAGPPLGSVDAIADWLPRVLDAAGLAQAALVGALARRARGAPDGGCDSDPRSRASRCSVRPVPMTDQRCAPRRGAGRRSRRLRTRSAGWSHSAGKQLGGNPVAGHVDDRAPSLRLMERSRPGALHADLRACHEYAERHAASRGRSDVRRCDRRGSATSWRRRKARRGCVAALAEKRVVTLPAAGHAMMAEAAGRGTRRAARVPVGYACSQSFAGEAGPRSGAIRADERSPQAGDVGASSRRRCVGRRLGAARRAQRRARRRRLRWLAAGLATILGTPAMPSIVLRRGASPLMGCLIVLRVPARVSSTCRRLATGFFLRRSVSVHRPLRALARSASAARPRWLAPDARRLATQHRLRSGMFALGARA